MKTHTGLFDQVCSFDNLLSAAYRAWRGKRFKANVAAFHFHLERELFALQKELLEGTYRPGRYTEFHVFEPKKRLISAAPYRDRVVHHALCNVIEPLFDRTFIFDSYACRKGKGTHRAMDRFQAFCRKNRYVLKCDIQKYFPSIDHQILFDLIARKIRDRNVLWLVKLIIDSSNPQEPVCEYFPGDGLFTPFERRRGIPIGNLTSQFFANIYLNGFDHFVQEDLRCRYYIRYVDDFAVLDDDKTRLHEVKEAMDEYLVRLRLKLHERKCRVFPVDVGTDFLGFRIYPTHRRLRRENGIRFRRRLKKLSAAYERGKIPIDRVHQSVQSWIGHASHGNTYGLRRALLSGVAFHKGRMV